MITIKSGENIIYHPRNPALKLVDPKLSLADNEAGSLRFKIYESNLNYGSIRKLFPLISVARNGKTIFKGRVISDRKDFYNGRTVEAEGKLAFFNDSCLEPFSFQGSPEELFCMIIESHNAKVMPWQQFRAGTVTVRDSNDYIVRSSENTLNTWAALKEKCFKSSLGGHIRIRYEDDGDYVDWLEDYEKVSSQSIEFARNMVKLSMETDATETYTAIRPTGAEVDGVKIDISAVNGGKTYLVDREKAEEYGIIFAPESESTWEDVTLPENLLRKAGEKLHGSMAALSEAYEINAVDLNLTDDRIEALDICEYVPVVSRPHGINGRYLLTRAEIAIDAPQNSVYYLGSTRRVLNDMNFGGTAQENIPQNVSSFKNDAGYISEEKAGELLTEYPKTAEVEEILAEYPKAAEVGELLAEYPKTEDVGKMLEGLAENMRGEDGKDGLSAYEVAVADGYAGTVGEWLESLKGNKGDSGKAATIKIGTVTTVKAGTQAGVENVGTETDAVLDFTIPQGEKGERGSPGASGGGGGAAGMYAFEIREDGHLWMVSETEIDAECFFINENGHLVYRVEG